MNIVKKGNMYHIIDLKTGKTIGFRANHLEAIFFSSEYRNKLD